jgi:hypothetical protein
MKGVSDVRSLCLNFEQRPMMMPPVPRKNKNAGAFCCVHATLALNNLTLVCPLTPIMRTDPVRNLIPPPKVQCRTGSI